MKKLKGYRLTMWQNDIPVFSSLFKFRTFRDGEKAGLKVLTNVRNAGVTGVTFTVFQIY